MGVTRSSSSTASTDDTTPRLRSGAHRRSLPSGRALVGGLLVTVAAIGVFAAYAGADEPPTTTVVVARADLEPGQRLVADDLEVRRVELPDDLTAHTVDDPDDLVGAVALGPVAAGELVQVGSVRAAGPAGDVGPEFSFAVERERALDGDVRAGEVVDLLATFGTSSDARTDVLARSARVLRVADAGGGTIGSSGRIVLTVALGSDAEVLDVAHASQVAAITVVRGADVTGDEVGS